MKAGLCYNGDELEPERYYGSEIRQLRTRGFMDARE